MIVFDLQPAQSLGSGNRGIGRYTRDLATALAERHPGTVDAFCFNPQLPIDPRLFQIVPSDLVLPITDLAGRSIDLFHVTSPFEKIPIGELLPSAPVASIVATCYDLIPYRFQQRYLIPFSRSEYITRLSLLLHCDAVVTDSASAADDCESLLGVRRDRLTVIGGGTNSCFRLPEQPLDAIFDLLHDSLPDLQRRFVLVPTGMDWRKNIDGAIDAYAALPDDLQRQHQLVINCKVTHHERRMLERMVDDAGCVGDVLISGFVSDDDLVRLYQTTELVLFPSKYEGFGLPVLEARRCGARVICSNVSSLPEVMPLPEATFNPWSTDEIAATLERALTDPLFAAALDTAPDPGFTFEQAADRTVEVYDRVITAKRHRRQRHRPRLAFATLLPPIPSGVADHSVRLIQAMQPMADITCFVPDDSVVDCSEHSTFTIRPVSLLPMMVAGGTFDAVLYTMGNNRFHRPFLDVIEQVPGHVLFHDVRLEGCYSADERQAIAEQHYADTVDTPLYAADVATRAVSCFVQSAHAAAMLHDDCGVSATDIGPHPMVPVPVARVDSRFVGPKPVTVVSLGIADNTKQSDKFARAGDMLLDRHPDWNVTLVGVGGPRFVRPGSRLGATGRVTHAQLDAWLDRATLQVQLRETSNGESSGAIADALSRGVPMLVTDFGSASELPDDSVVKVAVDITDQELAIAIEALVDDAERRESLGRSAHKFATGYLYRNMGSRLLTAMGIDRYLGAS